MKANDLAQLEDEISLLLFRIEQCPAGPDRDLALSQGKLVQEIVNDEAKKKIRAALKRRAGF